MGIINLYYLHGFLGLPSDWDQVIRQVYPTKNILNHFAVDYLQDSELKPQNSMDQWAYSFNNKISSKEKNILVGYSLGGRLALHCIYNNPNLWHGGIVISAHPGNFKNETFKNEKHILDKRWSHRFLSDSWPDLMRDWNAQTVFLNSNQKEPIRNEQNYNRKNLAQILINWSSAKQQDFSNFINEQSSLVVLVGEMDEKYIELTDGIKNRYIVPQSGHRILFDNPQWIGETIAGRWG